MDERISIIVPVYRVEEYLEACVESICGQTYRNLEILLIDDGSPDGCPALCDALAERDPRIRVFHKENGGLSDARNFGIRQATGTWLGFVDSDDTVTPDMYETLYRSASEQDAQMAVGGIAAMNPNGAEQYRIEVPRQCLSRENAMIWFAKAPQDNDYAVNKLYRRELFQEIRYPVGQYYEDIFTTYRLMDQCRRIAFVPGVGYFYLLRSGSICHDNNMARHMAGVEAKLQKLRYYEKNFPETRSYMARELLEFLKSMLQILYTLEPASVREEKAYLRRLYRQYRKEAVSYSVPDRAVLLLADFWPGLYCRLIRLTGPKS